MKTEELIKNVNYIMKKHEQDIVGVGETNIYAMCNDILPALEQLARYQEAEKATNEYLERIAVTEEKMTLFPFKLGDVVYELCCCDDNVWRVFPMTVKSISPFGSIRWVKGKDPTMWNIYAESNDSTYMYKSMYDLNETLFTSFEAATAKLNEILEEEKCKTC